MPELPEVENVKLSLERQGAAGQVFKKVELLRAGLRTPFARDLSKRLKGESITAIRRRAKFLLFETEHYVLLSHLGMTGSWRVQNDDEDVLKHDHVILHFTSGLKLTFNDPRRFGILELLKKEKQNSNRWLKNLGVEPLEPAFTDQLLYAHTRRRKGPIKGLIMNQSLVVGVGNIYASEALYRAKIKPVKPAGKLSRNESGRLVASIKEVLQQAIAAGGSTISDYRNSEGTDGAFQNQFLVYDRAGQPCQACGTPILSRVIAGRNTFWCRKCQH